MQPDTYLGVQEEYKSYLKRSGSKFYGYLFPVKDLADFDERIKSFKQEFADATHVCSACVIGINREIQKFSDDGEPSNSSGRPMLHALLSNNLTYTGTAVVRYYGGSKLGIPGLIEAYGGATLESIEAADIEELVLKEQILCTVAPEKAYLLYNFLSKQRDVTYNTSGDKFIIECSKSMTVSLRLELIKIDTLAILNEI
jgi:uncharacterized YigZ family protein